VRAVRSLTVRPHLPEALAGLDPLAANLRWTWHRPTRQVFAAIDPLVWDRCGSDPRVLLATVGAERLDALATDDAYLTRLADAVADLEAYLSAPPTLPVDGTVAYFSPEFGISEVVPQYSGGLGVLAGDHLKAASDLGVPLVGIGLFYRHGYFRQSLSLDGWQQERFPNLDPYAMSMTLCEGIRVEVDLNGDHLVAQVWRTDVGRSRLYLLDADVDENPDHLRLVTDRLYGGDVEHRLRQEILLGVGGIRALEALGIDATVFHTNEGHAGFLGLERIRRLMANQHLSFAEAYEASRAGCVFTTHTPVPAGIDRFPRELMERYFARWMGEVGLDAEGLMALGHRPDEDPTAPFNMAVMGMRLAARRNGVAALHGVVSRDMFADLWPGVPLEEVPVGSVTNGVHGRTWVSREIDAVVSEVVGADWESCPPERWVALDERCDPAIAGARRAGKERLVARTREHLRTSGLSRGLSASELAWCDHVLDADVLTIGFARRFATYKRAALLLSQPHRLRHLLLSADRPVQFVFAGKAHPADDAGKELIRQVVTFSHDPQLRTRFVFLDDYDMSISRTMLQGVDVWLNTPLRPHEACGTSGMKAAMNGAPNCSILDGWWDECFTPEVGWAISSAESVADEARRNEVEANSLFELLEQQIVPLYYDDPAGWMAGVRACMAQLTPQISAHRMVRDYVEQLYRPAAADGIRLLADDVVRGRELAAWVGRVRDGWHQVHVDELEMDEGMGELGSARRVGTRVQLGSLSPDDVTVEAVFGHLGQSGEIEEAQTVALVADGEPDGDGHRRFVGEIPLTVAGRQGITARVVPHHELVAQPLDLGLVAWAG